jgi:hypothetical protein
MLDDSIGFLVIDARIAVRCTRHVWCRLRDCACRHALQAAAAQGMGETSCSRMQRRRVCMNT